MKVRELIEKLQKFDPEEEIVSSDWDGYGLNIHNVYIGRINEDTGSLSDNEQDVKVVVIDT